MRLLLLPDTDTLHFCYINREGCGDEERHGNQVSRAFCSSQLIACRESEAGFKMSIDCGQRLHGLASQARPTHRWLSTFLISRDKKDQQEATIQLEICSARVRQAC